MSETSLPADGSLPLSLEQRLDTLCCRFEAAWRGEQHPVIEHYLGEVVQEARAALLHELLAIELAYRQRAGGPAPTLDEYQRRFPEQTLLLQKVFGPLHDPCSTCAPESQAGLLGSQSVLGGGRYLPLRSHARGGLGEVHVAEDVELHREVALKRIQDQYAHLPDYRQRFLREAQITGWLEHPGIVPVYGLVQDPDGRPCYAMRFVRGGTLRDAIRQFHGAEGPRRDPTERRLALQGVLGRFIDVCNTVAYAHSRDVIHRDLKPANVMLGNYGETLVVDWGCAKWFQGERSDRADGEQPPAPAFRPSAAEGDAKTRDGATVGTPVYMSPEQAAGVWGRVGPASDIYSLGATLYEILVNRAPVEGPSWEAALMQARRGEFRPPREVRREVPPALEAICLRAMAFRPEDRYPTAVELAGDVERWLADEPVSAYPDGWALRVRRWAKRHSTLVTGAITLLVTAVLTLSGRTAYIAQLLAEKSWLLQQESHAKNVAHLAKTEAEEEAEKARKMFGFLAGTFKTTDALGIEGVAFRKADDQGKTLTANKILELGVEQARTQFENDPLLHAQLLDSIGHVYRSWGEYDRARQLLEQARDLRQDHRASPLDIAASSHSLGRCYHDLGHYEKAEEHYQQALAIRRHHLNGDDPQVIATEFDLGWLFAENKHPAGEELLLKVIETRRRMLGDGHRDVAVARLALAASLSDQGHSVRALILGGQAMGGLKDHKLAGAVCEGIEAINARRGKDPGKAVTSQQKVQKLLIEHLGNKHPYVALIKYQLAQTLQSQGNTIGAEEVGRECLQSIRGSVGFGHPLAIIPVEFHANLLARKGAFAEGEMLYRELANRRRERFGDQHPLVGVALVKTALYLTTHGEREKQARRLLEEANGIFLNNALPASKYPAQVHFSRHLGQNEPDAYTAFSPDGSRYFAGGTHPRAGIYDVTTGECLQDVGPHTNRVYGAAFAPGGMQLLTADGGGGLLLWPAGPRDPLNLVAAAVNTTGSAALPVTGAWCAGSSLVARTSGAGGEPRRMVIPVGAVHNVAVSGDGRWTLSSGADGTVRVFELATGRLVAELKGPPKDCYATFSPDGQYVLSGHQDGRLRLWEVATGEKVREFRGHENPVNECYFLPDGKQALSYAEDKTFRLWDIESGQEIRRHLLGNDPVAFRGVAVSPDGRRFLSLHNKGRSLRLCEVSSGKEIHRFELNSFSRDGAGGPAGVSFSPDGRRAVCGSSQGLVYLFHLPE